MSPKGGKKRNMAGKKRNSISVTCGTISSSVKYTHTHTHTLAIHNQLLKTSEKADLSGHYSKEDLQTVSEHMKRCSTLLKFKDMRIKTQ